LVNFSTTATRALSMAIISAQCTDPYLPAGTAVLSYSCWASYHHVRSTHDCQSTVLLSSVSALDDAADVSSSQIMMFPGVVDGRAEAKERWSTSVLVVNHPVQLLLKYFSLTSRQDFICRPSCPPLFK